MNKKFPFSDIFQSLIFGVFSRYRLAEQQQAAPMLFEPVPLMAIAR